MGIRTALLVGTARYRDPTLSRLRTPAQDARRLGDLLRDTAIGRFDHVQVLVDARKQEIEEEIEDLFADRSPDDLVLLYLACHGVKNDRGRLFFAAGATELSRLNSTAVSAANLNEIMEQSRAGMKVAMLDCCFSGAYARGLAPRSGGDQLAQQIAGRGTFVMTATDALEYAYEDGNAVPAGEEQSSVFTRSVIEGLASGDADLENDGFITADELFAYVEQRVGKTGRQTPKRFCVNVSGTIPIAWVLSRSFARQGRAGEGECNLGELVPTLAGENHLTVPLGLARTPGKRDRTTFTVDLSSWAGNIAVAGASQSGKTTLLRTLVCALALTHSPVEVQAYCLDFDSDLGLLAGLPHVGGVASHLDPALVTRIVTMTASIVDQRRERFPKLGIESMRAFRMRRQHGEFADDRFGDVFLVIDGWSTFTRQFAELREPLLRVAEDGLRFGVHLALSAPSWRDVPDELRRRLPIRIELPLGDPNESEFDSALAAEIPSGKPGRALVRGPAFLDVSLPRIDGSRSDHDLGEGLTDLVAQVSARWSEAIAPPVLAEPGPSPATPPSVTLPELLAIGNLRKLPIDRLWAARAEEERLRIPIGVAADGTAVVLDLKETAQNGMGPHGVMVGTTGSGKSELLRAIVLSLALTHRPNAVNMLLVDATSDDTFAGLGDLPHVAGVDTNVLNNAAGAYRLAAAIQGEMVRRQEQLRAGHHASIREYERARQAGVDLIEIPILVLVIDGFTELLAALPEFIDILVSVARIGRSLGIHMMLASQRIEEGRLRGLDTHMSFRIALRTFSPTDSRVVIGVPDAYDLPVAPGDGYLQTSPDVRVRFRGARVSVPANRDTAGEYARTVLEVLVDGLKDHASQTPAICLPPLAQPPTLNQLWSAVPGQPGPGRLLAPVGLADKPLDRSQPPLVLNLTGDATLGNVAIIGSHGSGKSTLAATLISSLALKHSPEEIQFFLLWRDAPRSFQPLGTLPHVSAATERKGTDREFDRRIVSECSKLIDHREQALAEAGIDSFADYRMRKAQGDFSEDRYGDVFLVIDGWRALGEQSDDLPSDIALIAQHGSAVGVHVVLTAEQWIDIPPSVKTALGTKIELKLADPLTSEINGRLAVLLPMAPGHGLTADGEHFLGALPRNDGVRETAGLRDAIASLVTHCIEQWPSSSAPRLRGLPHLVSRSDLPAPSSDLPMRIPVGLDEELRPAFVDFGADPHFLLFGDRESGKTSFLRLLARSISATYGPEQARIIIVDYRRTLLDAVSDEHLIGYAASHSSLEKLIHEAAEAIRQRMPGPDTTAEQLRGRSWWKGPELVLIVDDFDLVTVAENPLAPLTHLLPQATDLGLHLVLARRTAGAGRAMFQPVIQRLRELDTPGILLSGDRDEGALLGRSVRPAIQPPGRGTLLRRRTEPVTIQLAYDGDHS